MKAEQMNTIFDQCIEDYHRHDNVDSPEENPHPEDTLDHLLYHKNWIDTVQWHLEDIIRDPGINAENALRIKRRIDRSNQERTDLVEKIDDYFLAQFEDKSLKPHARLNTESPAWAIDRLSILALKIYHMKIEAERGNQTDEKRNQNQFKLNVLLTQRADLSLAINQLLEDLSNGEREMKVYRQMKMYNDPELNPILYAQKKS